MIVVCVLFRYKFVDGTLNGGVRRKESAVLMRKGSGSGQGSARPAYGT